MDVFTAIFQRQSLGKVKLDPVPRELIEKILSAAVQAPNHHHVRPWRFIVIQGDARAQLGEVMAQGLTGEAATKPDALLAERAKPLRAPLLIAVGVDQPHEPKVKEWENICAAAAATQNLLLAAHALGLVSIWRSGGVVENISVKKFLGLLPEQRLLGFVYVGYPLQPLNEPQRPSFEDRTTWLG